MLSETVSTETVKGFFKKGLEPIKIGYIETILFQPIFDVKNYRSSQPGISLYT